MSGWGTRQLSHHRCCHGKQTCIRSIRSLPGHQQVPPCSRPYTRVHSLVAPWVTSCVTCCLSKPLPGAVFVEEKGRMVSPCAARHKHAVRSFAFGRQRKHSRPMRPVGIQRCASAPLGPMGLVSGVPWPHVTQSSGFQLQL